MGQLTIDTLNKADRENAMIALHVITVHNEEEPLFCPIEDFKEQVAKYDFLNAEYQNCKKEKDLFEEELRAKTERNETLFEANKNLCAKVDEYDKLNNELKEEIKKLKERLSGFIIGFGSEGENESKYFKPEERKLENTIQNTAFFIGASKGENIFEFQFNEERAPHQKAIQSRSEVLIPFCDIEFEVPDANYIVNKHNGLFSINNGEFTIIEKAKISIVKQ